MRHLEAGPLRALDLHDFRIVDDDLHDSVTHGLHFFGDDSQPGRRSGVRRTFGSGDNGRGTAAVKVSVNISI